MDEGTSGPRRARKKLLRSVIFSLAAASAVVACLVALAFWWASGLADTSGPLHGRPAARVPDRDPDQVLRIDGGLTLEVFNELGTGQAPIVRLLDRESHALWAIHAEGRRRTDVRSIRFERREEWGSERIHVNGIAEGERGMWRTTWIITRAGELREYSYYWR